VGLYDRYVLPRLIGRAMRAERLRPYRERVVGQARGRVLEIGAGAGANRAFYSKDVQDLLALEPHPQLRALAEQAGMRVIGNSAERIPLDDASVDTVVTTWTLCSIADASAALVEMRRVLRPDGRLLFAEHGLAPEVDVQRWQHRLTPLWKHIAGGCHLNRPIPALVRGAGFEVTELRAGYMEGPRPMAFLYEGEARPG
jgi:ubiquinone/menaquinone biosynthesis C-methylase UbiE